MLGLWRGDALWALVVLVEDPEPQALALVAAARDAGLEVILAGGTDGMAARLGDVGRWRASDVADEIRIHQRAGNVVLYASGRAHRGLRSADVGIGVQTPHRRAPFGAHVVIDEGLGQGFLLIDAVRRARRVSRRSALLAATGAGVGAGWALVGAPRLAASRSMLAINASALASIANGAAAGLGLISTAVPRAATVERWHELDAASTLRAVGSDPTGLTDHLRSLRLAQAPPSPWPEPVGWLRATVDELANPLTPLLGMGAALSAAVGSATDAGLVLGVVGVNALVGAAQRVQTERALHDLDAVSAPDVRVRIDGAVVDVPAELVVIGDVLELEAGARVPADCRVIEAHALEVDESTLTGESLPVTKSARPTPGVAVPERACMLYEGTVIAAGHSVAVVVATGVDTEAGRSLLAAGSPPATGVEQRLRRLTNLTLPVTLGAGVLATGLSFAMRRPTREAVGTGVSLMVAAVPEGLPALATLAQVAAARRLADRHALVRNPRAIEALGRVEQVCFDKTGTLTEGTLALVAVSDGRTDEPLDALAPRRRAVLALAAQATPPANGNGTHAHATDRAVAEAAASLGLRRP
ncbi:MAG: HAD-IC family P-type ATPase, partial [Acidimicrobiales bacterium]|nr:HAD-IC family P-type ATPase [Acidimicrobiales bacterium]